MDQNVNDSAAIAVAIESAIDQLWHRGWQPADLARVVGRQLGPQHQRLVSDAIASQLRQFAPVTLDPRWHGQLAELEARPWWLASTNWLTARCDLGRPRDGVRDPLVKVLELLTLLGRLPAIEQLGPLPGSAPEGRHDAAEPGADRSTAGPGPREVDERALSRIRALLAKAESTTYPAEAEAYTAAAQERMARHSINAAMLDAAADSAGAGRSGPGARRIGIDQPYETSRAVLLSSVAEANRCRAVWTSSLGFSTVVGFEPDLDAVESLYTSLLVQAVAAMNRAGTGASRRSRTFRQSFLTAYGIRIGERLKEITRQQTEAAATEPGRGDLLPVLTSRNHDVDERLHRIFPSLTHRTTSRTADALGYSSGRGAADQADLAAGPRLRPNA